MFLSLELTTYTVHFTARRNEVECNKRMNKKQTDVELIQDESSERRTKKAFLDLLLEVKFNDGLGFSNSDIQEEVDTFMFEGHDTTTCSLAWTIFLIGHYPKVLNNHEYIVYKYKSTSYSTLH